MQHDTEKLTSDCLFVSDGYQAVAPCRRQHSSPQRRKLKAILQQFGQVVPLPLDAATGTLIDGHGVFDALVELGHDEIAVVRSETGGTCPAAGPKSHCPGRSLGPRHFLCLCPAVAQLLTNTK